MSSWVQSAVALTAALACATPGSAAASAHKTYALVIGNNEPAPGKDGEGLAPLRFADDDAVRYAELLRQFADDVRLVTVLDAETRRRFPNLRADAPPRLSEVRRELRALIEAAAEARAAGDSVTFYVVFSGHGSVRRNGEAVLAFLDGSLTRQGLFDDILAPIEADTIHLILDACHAAGVVGVRGRKGFGKEIDANASAVGKREAADWTAQRTLARFPHVGVLAATTAGEQAHEWSEIESGVFSHEVLSALWGAGDVNGDLAVEYTEVQAFVAAANRTLDDPRAAPKVVARPPATDPHAPLVDLARMHATTWISGDASRLGHFTVELADGRRHLDANVDVGSTTIAIPTGVDAFLRAGDLEAPIAAGEPRQQLAMLDFQTPSSGSRGSTASAYRRQLFAEPYTLDYYRGYVDSIDATPVRFDVDGPARDLAPPPTVTPASAASVPAPRVPDESASEYGPDEPPRPQRPLRARLGWGATFAALGGAAAVAGAVTGGLALQARSDFRDTDIERDAERARSRYRTFGIASVTTLAFAATFALLAAPLLRSVRADRRRQKAEAATRAEAR